MLPNVSLRQGLFHPFGHINPPWSMEKKSMLEMSCSGEDHGHVMCITKVDAQLILDGTSGLYNGSDTCIVGNLHTVREREEGITGHHSTVQIKIK